MRKIVALMFIILLTLTWPVLAQQAPKGPGAPTGGPGPGTGPGMGLGPQGPMIYNPQTVTTVKGTVESLENLRTRMPHARRPMMSRIVVLKTEQGNVTVHLGPLWYVAEEKFPLKVGQALEVTGSKVDQDGTSLIVAKEAKSDGQTLQLRDEQGLPLWRGAGRGLPSQAK